VKKLYFDLSQDAGSTPAVSINFYVNLARLHKNFRLLHYINSGGNMALIKCFVCSKEFERKNSEIKRSKKKERKTFCSRSCSGKHHINNIPEDTRKSNVVFLRRGSCRDKYSPFRFFLKVCRLRVQQKPDLQLNLSLQDLKDQWEKQKGICPYTGWSLKIAECQSKEKIEKTPDRASLDRIDSSKGYVKGNIQFVSLIAQYAKNNWDGEVVLEFAEAVKNFNSTL